jgi:nucleoside-diphosphate-sugar epimerase
MSVVSSRASLSDDCFGGCAGLLVAKILVTGAAGFTGLYVGPLLAAQGHQVEGLSTGGHGLSLPGYTNVHESDIRDRAGIRRLVAEIQPDHVVHLAAIAFVAHDDVDDMYGVNLMGTRHLLEALSELPVRPRSVLLASSANIYGNSTAGVLDEGSVAAPANDYGVTKLAMEYLASIYRPSLPIVIARPFNYTGRGQSNQFLIPKIVNHACERAAVIELGNLDVARDFSDVRMIADAYARLLFAQSAIGETFNVCSGRAIALRDVLDLVMSLSGHHFEVNVNPSLVRPNEVRSLHGSRAKLEGVIGPLLSIPLEETLRWMLDD